MRPDAHLAVIATVSPIPTDTEHSISTLRTVCAIAGYNDSDMVEEKQEVSFLCTVCYVQCMLYTILFFQITYFVLIEWNWMSLLIDFIFFLPFSMNYVGQAKLT